MRAFARAASAPTPRKGQLSDRAYLGIGLVAFLAGAGIEYGFYHRLLRDRLVTRDIAQIRPAINRWLIATVAWQVLVISACVVYMVALSSTRGKSPVWIVPPVGAAFGIAMPLQLIVMAVVRAVREAR